MIPEEGERKRKVVVRIDILRADAAEFGRQIRRQYRPYFVRRSMADRSGYDCCMDEGEAGIKKIRLALASCFSGSDLAKPRRLHMDVGHDLSEAQQILFYMTQQSGCLNAGYDLGCHTISGVCVTCLISEHKKC